MATPNGGTATAGLGDLLRLGARMGTGWLRERGEFDAGATGCRWARELVEREGGRSLTIAVAGKRLEVVTTRDRSEDVLAAPPDDGHYTTGHAKRNGMGFLAPHALTITDGAAWARLRTFNERVLGVGAPHPFAQTFLDRVRNAFAQPVAHVEDVRRDMGRAMVGIVLGDDVADGADPAEDVRVLFGVVQSPLRRKLLGFRYHARRERLYAHLARAWDGADDSRRTLIALARSVAPDLPRQQLLEQVPHWMFTFTGSGTDLLARTLALITSRPLVRARVRQEIAAAGPLTQAASYDRMPYLNACINETGRLFPPVTRTFHRPPARAGNSAGDVVHFFLLLQRDETLGPTVHAFRPERWLSFELDEPAAASNLFLRGPRTCPGKDLILFVCRAALARQIAELNVAASGARLARDPLPVSFPKREARFTTSETRP